MRVVVGLASIADDDGGNRHKRLYNPTQLLIRSASHALTGGDGMVDRYIFAAGTGLLLAAGSLTSARVQAQSSQNGENTSPQLEEIVITAQKRTEKLQDVPVSAVVLSNATLANSNVSDVSDLNKLVPSLNINGTISGRAPMGIRGVSSVSNEQAVGVPSGVAIMIDGVPVPSDSYDGNQVEDMQSVEVLKGPQATLGGRSAATGVINYVTYNPTDTFTGGISATGTTDSEYRVSAHVSGPLAGPFDFSLSAYDAQRYYPITNAFYDTKASQRDNGVRAKLLWKITDDISAKLTLHHAEVTQQGANFVYVYATPGADLLFTPGPLTQSLLLPGGASWTNLKLNSPVNTAGHTQDDNDAQLDLSFDLGSGYTLTSTSAFQHEDQQQIQDIFATAAYFFDTLVGGPPFTPVTSDPKAYNDTQLQHEIVTQKSEELKLVSPVDQAVSFVAGFFYSDTTVQELYTRDFVGAPLDVQAVPNTATTDLYGRATWKLAPSTSLVTGVRYNYDRLEYTYNQVANGTGSSPHYSSGSNGSSAVVGDISLQQQFSPDVMGYATYSRGYSPKVYNTAAELTSNAPLTPVGQEHVDNFEIGLKGSYLDHTLIANLAVFDTIYHDYQINTYLVLPGQIVGTLNIDAAGKAETRGVEFDTTWRATNLTTLSLSTAYIDAVFKDWTGAPCVPYYPNGISGGSSNCTLTASGDVLNMSGQTMPNAPKFKIYLDAEQRIPLGSAPYELLVDDNWSYRSSAQMLPDNNPAGVQGAFGVMNFSVGLHSNAGWSVTAFCNNVFNRIYYQDVEDFWSSAWSNSSTVIAQPARDAQRYGGLRFDYKF
jgi:iron complex outermembrane recepter protein